MKIIQDRLHHVASQDATHPTLGAPFPFTLKGEAWEGVTNGHCALAWPAQFGFAPVENAPGLAVILSQTTQGHVTKRTTLDALRAWCAEWLPVDCAECAGTGCIEQEADCDTCDGAGYHECRKCDAEHECGHCKGTGKSATDTDCPACHGLALRSGNERGNYGGLGGDSIDRHVLARVLMPLDGDGTVEVSTGDGYAAVRIVGPGFLGLLMPVRWGERGLPVFDGWTP